MVDSTDMSTPVTRGELRAELAQFEIRLEQKLEQKLEIWGGALLARIESTEQRLLSELARHAKAFHEAMMVQISVIDEKYADLPQRVSQLEAKVFARKKR